MMMLPSCFISFVWHARTHAHTTVIVRQAIFVPACYAIFTLIEGRCTVFCLHQARAAPMTDSRWRRLCLQIKTSDDIESPLWQHPIQSSSSYTARWETLWRTEARLSALAHKDLLLEGKRLAMDSRKHTCIREHTHAPIRTLFSPFQLAGHGARLLDMALIQTFLRLLLNCYVQSRSDRTPLPLFSR